MEKSIRDKCEQRYQRKDTKVPLMSTGKGLMAILNGDVWICWVGRGYFILGILDILGDA